ncbi:TetR/AcrR family transcriptional regulator [Rhodococcus sp. IEGM 1379]|uniref:TetR/AcrR family transcriptional regulator n=1 Tax=Rhodococcus sp. IEGM 1379 TaxID=3047086 RepID=UPI0024B76870|nr:TetR/AcrR family transcriptional regulator [Rhodococcus sp. IEGM 1379]MDI9914889.1 TetR/AcrR family transcriptional regulator [Rhodococcus sp. IEGM 1379]
MTGKRLGPQDRREQIIVSAAKVFESKSYADVSMTELAKAAGVGRPCSITTSAPNATSTWTSYDGLSSSPNWRSNAFLAPQVPRSGSMP